MRAGPRDTPASADILKVVDRAGRPSQHVKRTDRQAPVLRCRRFHGLFCAFSRAGGVPGAIRSKVLAAQFEGAGFLDEMGDRRDGRPDGGGRRPVGVAGLVHRRGGTRLERAHRRLRRRVLRHAHHRAGGGHRPARRTRSYSARGGRGGAGRDAGLDRQIPARRAAPPAPAAVPSMAPAGTGPARTAPDAGQIPEPAHAGDVAGEAPPDGRPDAASEGRAFRPSMAGPAIGVGAAAVATGALEKALTPPPAETPPPENVPAPAPPPAAEPEQVAHRLAHELASAMAQDTPASPGLQPDLPQDLPQDEALPVVGPEASADTHEHPELPELTEIPELAEISGDKPGPAVSRHARNVRLAAAARTRGAGIRRRDCRFSRRPGRGRTRDGGCCHRHRCASRRFAIPGCLARRTAGGNTFRKACRKACRNRACRRSFADRRAGNRRLRHRGAGARRGSRFRACGAARLQPQDFHEPRRRKPLPMRPRPPPMRTCRMPTCRMLTCRMRTCRACRRRPNGCSCAATKSQGVTYFLYADGSIDARAPSGLFSFKSLDELRQFIEKRQA